MEFISASKANEITTAEVNKQVSSVSIFNTQLAKIINDKIVKSANKGLYGVRFTIPEDSFTEGAKNVSEEGIPFILEGILEELENNGYEAQYGFTPSVMSRSINGKRTPWSIELKINWRYVD